MPYFLLNFMSIFLHVYFHFLVQCCYIWHCQRTSSLVPSTYLHLSFPAWIAITDPFCRRPGLSFSGLAFHHSLKFYYSDFFKAGHKFLQSLHHYLWQMPDLPVPVPPQPLLLVRRNTKELVCSLLHYPWPPLQAEANLQWLFPQPPCCHVASPNICLICAWKTSLPPHVDGGLQHVRSPAPCFHCACSCLFHSTMTVAITVFMLGFDGSSH